MNCRRMIRLEVTIENIDHNMADIKLSLINMDKKIDTKFDILDIKIDSLNNRLWTNFFWMIGGFASTLAIIAHAFHWI